MVCRMSCVLHTGAGLALRHRAVGVRDSCGQVGLGSQRPGQPFGMGCARRLGCSAPLADVTGSHMHLAGRARWGRSGSSAVVTMAQESRCTGVKYAGIVGVWVWPRQQTPVLNGSADVFHSRPDRCTAGCQVLWLRDGATHRRRILMMAAEMVRVLMAKLGFHSVHWPCKSLGMKSHNSISADMCLPLQREKMTLTTPNPGHMTKEKHKLKARRRVHSKKKKHLAAPLIGACSQINTSPSHT